MGGKVGPFARAFTGVLAVWGIWQLIWLTAETDWLNRSLPHPFTVTFWIIAWAFLAGVNTIATVTGEDAHARVALAATCVALSMAAVSEILSDIDDWWWQLGQTATLFCFCMLLLVSPLRWGLTEYHNKAVDEGGT